MPAPSTAVGQTSATPAAPAPSLGSPRSRRRAPALPPTAGADPEPGTGKGTAMGAGAAEQAGDVVRWAVFCCVLVPVVLVVYGTSLGGAAGTALGLVSVTAACRLLLRRSERGLRSETVRPGRRH
ncbi:hypothetical protein [Streptomyces sp. TLI_105]|uniref:hypothetical protein n=1 Tax=Streptomyces sp. TLI_105 TaxID=1881019 RepID=UPI000898BFFC|nr:hypothetical protein [Streptomyces sp. TLI_105]SED31590.1 hypothetical protein SAMN05428939_4858 [Streptomyces sp. TLI_105]